MGLSCTVSEINCDFSIPVENRKIFPSHLYFAPLLKRFPIGIGYRRWGLENENSLPGWERILTISSAVWIQCTNVTDGGTDIKRQQRPHLRIASRGKNWLGVSDPSLEQGWSNQIAIACAIICVDPSKKIKIRPKLFEQCDCRN